MALEACWWTRTGVSDANLNINKPEENSIANKTLAKWWLPIKLRISKLDWVTFVNLKQILEIKQTK